MAELLPVSKVGVRGLVRGLMALCLVSGGLLATGAPLGAQAEAPSGVRATPPPSAASEPGICFRGRPLPRCRAFMLFELGYAEQLAGSEDRVPNRDLAYTTRARDLPSYFAWEIGGMVNRDSAHALGATLHVGTGHPPPRGLG